MPGGSALNVEERRKCLKQMQERYLAADRSQKGELLSHLEVLTGLHRKSLVRLMRAASLERKGRTVQRGRIYGAEVSEVVRVVWESLDYICAARLVGGLQSTARQLARFGEVRLSREVEELLGRISRSSVQRLLGKFAQDSYRLPRRGPEAANRLLREVPMGRLPWQTNEPGHFEVDLVHHCGTSSSGEYIHSLQLVDVATGWSERVAVLGRSQRAMEEGFRRVQARLPFPIRELHPDNGSEFFNDHLVRYWGESISGLMLSRSRPWHKNDNRFVEQKNDTLIRAYFGHERLQTPQQCEAMNVIYEQLWVYYNLFQPVLHLAAKQMVGGTLKRRWDRARTPFERLLESGLLSLREQATLQELYARTNPRRLRAQIHQLRDGLWNLSLVGAGKGEWVTLSPAPAGRV